MVGNYEVKLGERTMGTVTVSKEGLYYRFSCRCSLTGEVMHRLWLLCDGRELDLGLCVPMGDGFGAEKKLPVKQCSGTPRFLLRPKRTEVKDNFIPLSPEEPFRYLHRLQDAFLERQGGQLGIVIKALPDGEGL